MAAKGPWFRKQNRTWYVQVNGRQVNLGKDKAEAIRRWHKLKGERSEGTPLGNHRIREILDDYWGWLQANRSKESCDNRKPVLKSFGEFLPARMRIMDLRPFHVQKWLDKTYPKCGPTRRHTLITWIKTACNWAVKMGYASANPIALMEKPTFTVRQEFLPADQWQKLIDACRDDLKDFIAFMLISGARVQEMFKYEASHLQGERLVLPIIDSKGQKRSRVVHLPPAALAIAKRLAEQNPTGKLFRTQAGKPWDRNNIRCRFKRLKRIMGMPKLCATTLRHSFAHYQLESGQDSLIVSKLLGHTDGRMLAQRYGHIEEGKRLAEAAKQIVPPLDLGIGPDTPQLPVA